MEQIALFCVFEEKEEEENFAAVANVFNSLFSNSQSFSRHPFFCLAQSSPLSISLSS